LWPSLTDPNGNTTQATVGLVGLHIIHKYPGAAQFVWATFEQIDNSPDDNNGGTATWPALPPNPNQKPSPGPGLMVSSEKTRYRKWPLGDRRPNWRPTGPIRDAETRQHPTNGRILRGF
jgi:hypothetical protein